MLRFESPSRREKFALSAPQISFAMPNLPHFSLLLPLLICLVILLPILMLAGHLFQADLALWKHLWATFLPTLLENTLVLVGGVGLGTFILGTGLAWLVSMYDFPLRSFFEHALLLPLAIPTYVMGFVFMGLFEYAGPIQSQLRLWLGEDIWFPQIRSGGGAILVMTLVLYPYVYLLARSAFREQAASTYEAAQVMGYNRSQSILRLVLPLARPSLVAGMTLAMMEALTDYGTVRFFNFPTLTEGVVRLWSVRYDREGATQLASLLLLFAFGMMLLEYALRGQARYEQNCGKGRRIPRIRLQGWKKWLAVLIPATLLFIAFILPVSQLILWSQQEIQNPTVGGWREVYTEYIYNSVRLASVTAVMVMGLALLVAHGLRGNSIFGKHLIPRLLSRSVNVGYAMPGAVIAIGVLALVAPIDHQVTDWVEAHLGRTDRSLLFTGTMMGLIYAYTVRFISIGFSSTDSSFSKITPSMEQAARTMGAGSARILWRIYLPLVSSGMAAGAILVFVDVMKELPATLLLRPFGMDTLALWAYFLASESFWQAAALPSLSILVVGLIPVVILMRVGNSHEK